MLVANLRDGSSETLDLSRPADERRWRQLQSSPELLASLSIKASDAIFSFPIPRRFRRVSVDAELVAHRDGNGSLVAETLTVYVDGVRAKVTVYTGGNRACRFELAKSGFPVYLKGQT